MSGCCWPVRHRRIRRVNHSGSRLSIAVPRDGCRRSWRRSEASFILGGDATTYATLSSDGLLSFAPPSGSRASLKLGQTTLVGLNADGSRLFAVRRDTDVLTLLVVSLPRARRGGHAPECGGSSGRPCSAAIAWR